MNKPEEFNTPVITGIYNTLKDTVKSFGCKAVQFSIFDTITYDDGKDQQWIIKYPDISSSIPLFKGDCRFCVNYWRVSDNAIFFNLENPTWKDIIVELDRILQSSGDGCGVFLESLNVKKDKFGIGCYIIGLGS